jgi:hypothetical protein
VDVANKGIILASLLSPYGAAIQTPLLAHGCGPILAACLNPSVPMALQVRRSMLYTTRKVVLFLASFLFITSFASKTDDVHSIILPRINLQFLCAYDTRPFNATLVFREYYEWLNIGLESYLFKFTYEVVGMDHQGPAECINRTLTTLEIHGRAQFNANTTENKDSFREILSHTVNSTSLLEYFSLGICLSMETWAANIEHVQSNDNWNYRSFDDDSLRSTNWYGFHSSQDLLCPVYMEEGSTILLFGLLVGVIMIVLIYRELFRVPSSSRRPRSSYSNIHNQNGNDSRGDIELL